MNITKRELKEMVMECCERYVQEEALEESHAKLDAVIKSIDELLESDIYMDADKKSKLKAAKKAAQITKGDLD